MAITLDGTNFSMNSLAPEGKIWGKLQINLTDQGDESGRTIFVDVLLDKTTTATFQDYEKLARQEAEKLLRLAADSLKSL